MTRIAALLLAYAGLAGAAGVSLAAAGAHGSGLADLAMPAQFLILHAAAGVAVVAVALRAERGGAFLTAALVLLVGVTLFSGDIAIRTIMAERLLPMAAPIGGTLMIFGWLVLAGAAVWEALSRRD